VSFDAANSSWIFPFLDENFPYLIMSKKRSVGAAQSPGDDGGKNDDSKRTRSGCVFQQVTPPPTIPPREGKRGRSPSAPPGTTRAALAVLPLTTTPGASPKKKGRPPFQNVVPEKEAALNAAVTAFITQDLNPQAKTQEYFRQTTGATRRAWRT
jgi:hypothetical protein